MRGVKLVRGVGWSTFFNKVESMAAGAGGGGEISSRTTSSLIRHLEAREGDVSSSISRLVLNVEGYSEKTEALLAPHKKVSVVGLGQVGLAVAYSIMNQGLCSELALVSRDKDKLAGEALDLKHGRAFVPDVTVTASTNFSVTKGSHVVVVCAGARQEPGESRLSLLQRNLDIFDVIIPQIVEESPSCTMLIVSNPVDVMTWMAWKLSGFPPGRVVGSGTALDSSRFRNKVAERLGGLATSSVHGYIIGEHGDSAVPVWSGLNIGGVRLRDLNPKAGMPDDPEQWGKVAEAAILAAYKVIALKGFTNSAVGLAAASLCRCILRNEKSIHPVSTLVQGLHGIKQEVFLSVPCVLGAAGVRSAIRLTLSDDEVHKLHASAAAIANAQKELEL